MPHAPRTWPSTKLHLVTTSGNGHCRLFLDAADRDEFLDLLDGVVERHGWELFAWSLLGNHLHLVVGSEPEDLYRGMQRLKSVYAMRFHRRHHTRGHLFKRPYDSRPILTEERPHRSCEAIRCETPSGTASSSAPRTGSGAAFARSRALPHRLAAT